ncbi:hypothetical protein [Rhizobium sullae]|uniref:hypothetical protein n=1 Tax=Rhizobium sullae TaxID=50338 RepID=UPI001AECC388|nr:hypothetical protein [Rhizobium sullae]
MRIEPIRSVPDHFIEGTGFFKKMARALDDKKLLLGFQRIIRPLIHFDHRPVETSDQKQSGCADIWQDINSQIGPAAARDDCRNARTQM